MKKLLSFVLTVMSLGFVGSLAETKANAVTTNPQVRIVIGRRHRRDWDDRYRYDRYRYDRNRDFNTRIETRIVRDGWRTYRDTYQVRMFPDGRTQWVLVSRDRVY